MPLTFGTNLSAVSVQNNLNIINTRQTNTLAKLSSGSRVPNAKADAASLAIGTSLKSDIAAFEQARINTQQGSSILQIADGAFQTISDALTRMTSLTTQSQSGQVSDNERAFLNTEFQELSNEIDRIADATTFNDIKLLGGINSFSVTNQGTNVDTDDGIVGIEFDNNNVTAGDTFHVYFNSTNNNFTITNGTQSIAQTVTVAKPSAGQTSDFEFSDVGVTITLNSDFDDASDIGTLGGTLAVDSFDAAAASVATSTTLAFQVGIGTTTGAGSADQIELTIDQGGTQALGVDTVSIDTAANAALAATALTGTNGAVDKVTAARAELGAFMNRLDFASNNLASTIESTEATRSALLDADIPSEITKFVSDQILLDAGASLLAQANQQPARLLKLLEF